MPRSRPGAPALPPAPSDDPLYIGAPAIAAAAPKSIRPSTIRKMIERGELRGVFFLGNRPAIRHLHLNLALQPQEAERGA